MTAISPSIQEQTEKLLGCKFPGDTCGFQAEAKMCHWSGCPAHYRPSVASALQELTDERDRLREFAKWCMTEGPWQGQSVDGADLHDKAVKFGVIVCVPYDPNIHGPNDCDAVPGSAWWELSWGTRTALTQDRDASTGEQKELAE